MDVRFKYNEPAEAEKIYFEQIFAEKPGGGIVSNPNTDWPPSTPVAASGDSYYIIPQFKAYEGLAKGSTSLKLHKTGYNTGTIRGLAIGFGKESVEISNFTPAIDSGEEFDVATLKTPFSKDIKENDFLYIAEEVSVDNAEIYLPMMSGGPVFVTGDWVYANQGDQAVRLINGANLRKETANIASEVAALLPGINLV